jgi:hypothetical protein
MRVRGVLSGFWCVFALQGCLFGACDTSPFDQTAFDCVDEDLPSRSPAIRLGRTQDDTFVEAKDGTTLSLDRGPQGGSHVFTTVRYFGDNEERLLLLRFVSEADGGSDGGSSAGGGPGAGGGADVPSGPYRYDETFVLTDQFDVGECQDEWYELRDLVFQAQPDGTSARGTLTASIGTCPTSGCEVVGSSYVLSEVDAEVSVEVTIE